MNWRIHCASAAAALLSAVAMAGAAAATIRCGSLTGTTVSQQEVEWVDLKKALLERRIEPQDTVPESFVTARPPADGREYVSMAVEIKPGSSLGAMDYKLALRGSAHDCLAMADGDGPFDPRRLEVVAEASYQSVRLLFEVPAGEQHALLVFALPTTLSVPDVQLTLRTPAPEASTPAAQRNGGTPRTAPSPDAGNPRAAEPKPAPEPGQDPNDEPEPKPEPEPEKSNDPWEGL